MCGQLPESADERADREADKRTRAEVWIEPPAERDTADDRTEVKKTRRHGGRAENIFGVQHSHGQRRQRDKQNERPHHPREQNSQLGFFRRPTPPRHHFDKLWREDDAEQRHRTHEDCGQCCDFVRQPPRRLITFCRDLLRERGDECSGERAFGKKIAQHVRQAKGHQKCVEISARAEKSCEHLLANQSEHATAQNRDTDDTSRARADSLIRRDGRFFHGATEQRSRVLRKEFSVAVALWAT